MLKNGPTAQVGPTTIYLYISVWVVPRPNWSVPRPHLCFAWYLPSKTATYIFGCGRRTTHLDVERPKRTLFRLCVVSLGRSCCFSGPVPQLHSHTAGTRLHNVFYLFVKDFVDTGIAGIVARSFSQITDVISQSPTIWFRMTMVESRPNTSMEILQSQNPHCLHGEASKAPISTYKLGWNTA